jgi:hypothetical protein
MAFDYKRSIYDGVLIRKACAKIILIVECILKNLWIIIENVNHFRALSF